ncbi:MAG TPA: extracellular solute-binding protein [Candidatus Limnocylindrales bacterium]|nr:extracellular solute-binding protein [Candidatus Limnocylindrales bacterium]
MRNRFLTLGFAAALVIAACGPSGSTGSGAPGSSTGTGGGAAFDPSTVSGNVTLGAWESSPAEGTALKAALDGFAAKYPNIKVTQQTVTGDYRVQMVTNFSSGNVPDIFYVNAEYAPEWMEQGFLEPLDDYIAKQNFDTSKFFPGYANVFKTSDGTTYGLPKDGNTIAMAYNTDLVTTAPTTLDQLVSTADSLKGKGKLKAPICISPGLDRGLAFIYAQGGSILSDDMTTDTVDSAATKAAVQWYMDLVKNGQAETPTQLGDGWCGEALGKGDAAIVFEGGWLKGALDTDFPDTKWAFAEMPAGSAGKATITYTGAYSIAADSKNKDAAWVVMQYLTGPEGMAKWTSGGIAIPSRSDVPTPAGFETIVAGAAYAKPGSGFIKGYGDIQKAFQDEFVKQITDKTYQVDPILAATKAKIDANLK